MCERLCEGCDSPHSSKHNSILVHRTPQWPGDSQKPEQHAWEETPQIYNRPSLPERTNQSRKLLGNSLGIHMEVTLPTSTLGLGGPGYLLVAHTGPTFEVPSLVGRYRVQPTHLASSSASEVLPISRMERKQKRKKGSI